MWDPLDYFIGGLIIAILCCVAVTVAVAFHSNKGERLLQTAQVERGTTITLIAIDGSSKVFNNIKLIIAESAGQE